MAKRTSDAAVKTPSADGAVPVRVSGAAPLSEIVASLEAAKTRVEKAGSRFSIGSSRETILDHLEQAKHMLQLHAEWEANRADLDRIVSGIRDDTVAARNESQALREQAIDLHKRIQERQTQVDQMERKLTEERSRIVAIEDREKRTAEREATLDKIAQTVEDRLDERRRELLSLTEKVKEDLTRIAAIESRERVVGERESTLDKRDAHLRELEGSVAVMLQKNLALAVKFDEHNASLVKRLEEAQAFEERLTDRERLVENREKAVEAWKLDLANREAELSAKVDEVHALSLRKEELQRELGAMREQRLAEIEALRAKMHERDVDLQRREKEALALGRALTERGVKLVERKQQLDEIERKLDLRGKEMETLRRELETREERIAVLEARVKTLDEMRTDLQKSLAKLRGEL